MSMLENKPNQIIRHILIGEIVQNNKKTDLYAVFMFISFGGYLDTLNGPKNVLKGL
jgi:hypothetical protein